MSALGGLVETRGQQLLQRWRERLRAEGLAPSGRVREDTVAALAEALRSRSADARTGDVGREHELLREGVLELAEQAGLSLSPAEVRALYGFGGPGPVLMDTLLDSAPVGLFFLDRELRYVRINQMLADINGVPVAATLGRNLWEVVPELAEGLVPSYREVFATGRPLLDQEQSGFTAAYPGETRYWRVSYYPVRDAGGAVVLVGGVLLDITDFKRGAQALTARQAELREAGQRLEAILETAVDGILTCDERGRIQRANSAAGRIFGQEPARLIGRDVRRLLAPSYRRELGRLLATSAAQGLGPGREWEVLGRRADGRVFPLELSVGEIRLPRERLYVGTVRDVTARKRAEEAQALFVETGTLLAQSLDVPTTLKSLAAVVVAHLADYCLVDLLDASGQPRRLEVAARDAEGQEWVRRLKDWPPDPQHDGPVTRALRAQRLLFIHPVTADWLRSAVPDPEPRAVLEALGTRALAFLPLRARGQVRGLMTLGWVRPPSDSISEDLAVAQGVADRAAVALDNARLYQEAQDAVRMREDVVAIVSHDLRNPLNAISLSATALARRDDVDERTRKSVVRISAAAERAIRLIRDLLDFTQARVGGIPIQRAPLDLHEHVRRVVDEVRLAWPGRHVFVHAEGEGQGAFDEGRLAQVITNLVGNALQHSPATSAVRVSTRGGSQALTLEVHNEGPPIPPALQAMLFEPYRRGPEASEGGGSLGLGLFISQQIVLGHGGRLWVRSQAGEGTTFTALLPRSPGE